jgi:hypothetical protein
MPPRPLPVPDQHRFKPLALSRQRRRVTRLAKLVNQIIPVNDGLAVAGRHALIAEFCFPCASGEGYDLY